jgi:two-component system, LuxR family, sensor kinase FixL
MTRASDAHSKLEQLYGSAPGFIALSTGPTHIFVFANASYARFVGRDNLTGRTVADALPEIVAQGFVAILDNVYETGVPFRGTSVPFDIIECQSGTATRRYADFVYQPIWNDRGEITGLFCEGYDVTEGREAIESLSLARAELIHLSRVNGMGIMAQTLAHELKQPLSAITNYTAGGLRRLCQMEAPDHPIAEVLHGIEEASQRAIDIISSLQGLTSRRTGHVAPFALKPAVEECIRLVRAATSPDIDILDRTPSNLELVAERIQVQQVIINLVRNACEAVQDADEKLVSVEARLEDTQIVLSVTDSGSGMSPKAAEDIFDWSHSTKESGMGLGLSICQTIIESFRGRIWLEHSSGDGSEMCFTLPGRMLVPQ